MEKSKLTRHIGLRVDQEFYDNLHYLAEYEGRTINGEIRFIVQKYMRDFEYENGPLKGLNKR